MILISPAQNLQVVEREGESEQDEIKPMDGREILSGADGG